MGKDAFDATVAALWRELGMPAPRPRAVARAALTVDGRAVALSLSPDERSLVAAAELGPLSRDPVDAADQMRRLLRDGCGLVLGRRAALRLRAGRRPEDPPLAEVQAAVPCDPRAARSAIAAIEDVLFLADVHAPTLARAGARDAAPAPTALDMADHLIFRP